MSNSKAELRAKALAKRDALSEKKRIAAAAKLAKRGLPFDLLPGSIVSGYSPIRSEIDPMPLLKKLAEQGAKLALPCVTTRGKALIFRLFHPNDRLMLGPLGIPEPSPAAAEVIPDIMRCRNSCDWERQGWHPDEINRDGLLLCPLPFRERAAMSVDADSLG